MVTYVNVRQFVPGLTLVLFIIPQKGQKFFLSCLGLWLHLIIVIISKRDTTTDSLFSIINNWTPCEKELWSYNSVTYNWWRNDVMIVQVSILKVMPPPVMTTAGINYLLILLFKMKVLRYEYLHLYEVELASTLLDCYTFLY